MARKFRIASLTEKHLTEQRISSVGTPRNSVRRRHWRLARSAAVAHANLLTACHHQHAGCQTPQQSRSLWIRLLRSSGARIMRLRLLASSGKHPRALRVSADTARSRTALLTALRRELLHPLRQVSCLHAARLFTTFRARRPQLWFGCPRQRAFTAQVSSCSPHRLSRLTPDNNARRLSVSGRRGSLVAVGVAASS